MYMNYFSGKISFFSFYLMLAFSLFSYTSCQKDTAAKADQMMEEDAQQIAPAVAMTDTFQIVITRGGGFTGQVKGFSLSSTGEVRHWQKMPGGEEEIVWETTVERDSIHIFQKELLASGAMEEKLESPGNVTTAIQYHADDVVRSWMWGGHAEAKEFHGRLRELWSSIHGWCRRINIGDGNHSDSK